MNSAAQAVTQAAPYVVPLMGAAGIVALIIQVIVKPIINHYLTKGTPNQNSTVRASVYAVALLVVSISLFLHNQLNTRADVSTALGVAFVVAGLAVTAFHVLTSDSIPSFPLPAVSLSTSPSIPAPVEPPPPKVKSKAVPGSANSVITAPATQTE